MKRHILISMLVFPLALCGQLDISKISGSYSDELGGFFITKLELHEDYTFKLNTIDPEFPYTNKSIESSGVYVIEENKVILNPNLERRNIEITLDAVQSPNLKDSIQFIIDYQVSYFKDNKFETTCQFDFETLTIFKNKKKKATHLTRQQLNRICLFQRKIKNLIVINESNTVKLSKEDIERIGIYSYGFDEIIWIDVNDDAANNFKIHVNHPIDREKMPRSKEVLIKKKKAYFYEANGRIDKSLTPLVKITSR